MKECFERSHLFRDGASILDLHTALEIQGPQKESDGKVHLFGLDKELICHGNHHLFGLLQGQDKKSKVVPELVLAIGSREFLFLKQLFSCRSSGRQSGRDVV